MIVQHVGLPFVLSIFFALQPGRQYYSPAHNERPLSKTSSEMGQQDNVQEHSYLNVVIDLKKDGSFKIVKAARIFGEVILRDFQTSDFIYEAKSGETTLAVAFFPEDPFLVRSLGDLGSAKESTAQANSAMIVVNIPLKHGSLAEIRKLRLKIFKLLPGKEINKIDASVLAEMKTQKRLILITDLSPKTFGRFVTKKLITVRN